MDKLTEDELNELENSWKYSPDQTKPVNKLMEDELNKLKKSFAEYSPDQTKPTAAEVAAGRLAQPARAVAFKPKKSIGQSTENVKPSFQRETIASAAKRRGKVKGGGKKRKKRRITRKMSRRKKHRTKKYRNKKTRKKLR